MRVRGGVAEIKVPHAEQNPRTLEYVNVTVIVNMERNVSRLFGWFTSSPQPRAKGRGPLCIASVYNRVNITQCYHLGILRALQGHAEGVV